ncbi:MAG TPA: thiamine pyrophosphate-dependent dehydrogenase E1 component subunit alpha [Dehalococcoidia bacterium]|nr:thiamine pyrophosphate-dependent dehydrogenase E1 component subunit alpha [Dehalococcoidia bacterium]
MELPNKDTLVKLYRDLLAARRVESELWTRQGNLAGSGGGAHRGPGEEVIPIAFCNNLTKTDCFMPNFRTGVCIFTKPGFTLKDVVAMSLGKAVRGEVPYTPDYGMLGGGGTLGEASVRYIGGAAAADMKKTGDIAVFIQGDGASNRAPTHEAMAVAGAWQLPIIFVIQNNRYGMGTAVEKSYNIEDLSLRGVGYGFPHDRVDGNDMIAMYLTAKKHVDRCRAGGGPSLIAADTWRLRPHFEGDAQMYRPKGEAEDWWKREPLARYQKELMDLGVLTEADVERLEKEVAAEIQAALDEVDKMPAITNVYEEMEKTAIDGL